MGAAASSFGFDKVNASGNGIANGVAILCANPNTPTTGPDNVTITWRDASGSIIKGPTTYTATPEMDDSDLITNLAAGDYSVEWITTQMTTPTVINFEILEPEALTLKIEVTSSSSIPNQGTLRATVRNAIGNVNYCWRNLRGQKISTRRSVSGLAYGVYSLEATDENGNKIFKCVCVPRKTCANQVPKNKCNKCCKK